MNPERWHEIHTLKDEGLSIRAIGRRLNVHRRTVREALRHPRPQRQKRQQRGSVIDPYRGWLMAKLQQYPELTAARLYHMLQQRGYEGGYTVVKNCVAELRPQLKQAYFSLAFPPGECAQVDWGVWKGVDVPGGRRRLSFFAMVLCHSRMMYAEIFPGETMEYWLTAHRNALNAFGGVPRKVMVDNCKTAVLKPAQGGESAVFNPVYLDFAAHYGFTPVACNPARPNEKGRVENAVGYIKSSFLAGRQPALPVAMAPALAHWLDTVANVRVHGTTRRRPVDLFNEAEKKALSSLPAGAYECAVKSSVVANSRFRVTVDTNRYSVPSQYASQRLVLQRYAERVVIRTPAGELIADHARSCGRYQDVLDPDHERDLILRTRHARDKRRLEHFLTLGSAAEAYLQGLQEKRPDWRSHVNRINALAEVHGRDELARVLADALGHNAFSSEYVHNILDARSRGLPEAGPLHVTRRSDLLDLDLPDADLSVYDKPSNPKEDD